MDSYGSTEGLTEGRAEGSLAANNPKQVESFYEDEDEDYSYDLSNLHEEAHGFMEKSSPYVAEFVGTFFIVFTMGCCSIVGDEMWNPTGVALMTLVAVYAFMPISGAHLNPAVTCTLCFLLKFPWAKGLGYIIMQYAGGLCGALAYFGIFNKTVMLGRLENDHKYHTWDVGVLEAAYTFMLSFAFANCVASRRNNRRHDQNHFFAIAIGFVYIAGGYPCLDITGSIFNPSATLAIGLTSYMKPCKECWPVYWGCVYTVAQFAGAWIASAVYAIVRPEDFKMQYDGRLANYEVPVRSKLTAELVGSFMIAMTVGLNVILATPAVPWSSAACYTTFIYSLGDVSGGHFNPAITMAAMLTRRDVISIGMGQSYIINQALGAFGAAFVFAHFDIIDSEKSPDLAPKPGYNWGNVACAEVLFTTLLCFTFLTIQTSTMPPSTTKTNFYFGLAIGSCIFVGGFAIGAISGGSLNPAVSFGRSFAQVIALASIHHKSKNWWQLLHCLYYSIFEIGGSIVAALLFTLTHQREYLKDKTNFPHIP